ncbi:CAF17-like 4Fe-4S cluster assembly/insertion protein YgfZ [Bradyrhizobium roseum]|uniref:CAF17-like 4Fe-4S cluster assembly/insertion protein YgfZ n=1 Tax=Bradyrhizobium roseum TaxID=3056648 RepID=UPI002631EB8F|nr:folate-binding protein [Bradyrhizobium roseus]WKA28523.1 folate-binding protein [Bradyrhizobium roseus]
MTHSLNVAVLPDRRVVAIGGADRVKFLQGLMTNDIRRLAADRALYGGFLTGQGKLLYDAFAIADGERILIDIAANLAGDLVKRLISFKLRAAVEIGETAPALAVAAAWGPGAATKLELESTEGAAGNRTFAEPHHAFVDPRIADLGVRLIYPADFAMATKLTPFGFVAATVADYTAHRLSLGIADTAEIGGEVCYPLEANFEMLHGVDFKKGCYVGQELTARMKFRGIQRKRILPVSGAAALPEAGTSVTSDGTELGPLIAASGTQGLALLRLDRLDDKKEGAIRARDVQLSIGWPNWLPR